MLKCKAFVCLLIVFAVGYGQSWAQETHYNSASGDWSTTGNWTNGEPDSSTTAYVGSDSGASTATVNVTQSGETCDYLYVGKGSGNQGTVVVSNGASLSSSEGIYVGSDTSGTVTQNGGTISASYITLGNGNSGSLGVYEFNGGILNASNLTVGKDWKCDGTFTQNGGQVFVSTLNVGSLTGGDGDYILEDGDLNISGNLSTSPETWSQLRQYGGNVDTYSMSGYSCYYKHGGSFSVQANITICDTIGLFQQIGGDATFKSDVSFECGGYVHIDGGQIRIDGNLNAFDRLGQDCFGVFTVAEGALLSVGGNITVDNTIYFRSFATKVEGDFVNRCSNSPGEESITDNFSSMQVQFEGGSSQIETAGKNLGAIEEAFEDNFEFDELIIGGDEISTVQLVNAFDNQPQWVGVESLYVNTLVVNAGSTLDLNGFTIYYKSGSFDPSGSILYNGGSLIQVPEPTALCLLSVGVGLLMRRRQNI